MALIVGTGVILGITGGFGQIGFLVSHVVVLCFLVVVRWRVLPRDSSAFRLAAQQARTFFQTPGTDRILGAALLAILTALTVTAAFAESGVVDAVTYHLPRIGHWLQDGRIQILATTEARINFVAVLPEIMMAWLLGATREGFHFVIMAQAIGGIMTVGATVGLARESGLGRGPALLAGGLLLGMANVVAQFTEPQTDLFTTGVFSVSFYLWVIALRRSESSVPGAMGAGLALGAKGTLFYLAPGALLWVGWLALHHPLSWPHWRRTLVAAVFGFGLFALPGFVRNWRAYGNAFGPEAEVKIVHQGFDSVSGQLHKLYWNFTSYLAQNFDPPSQPHGLRIVSRKIGESMVRFLPESDPYTMHGSDRRKALTGILKGGNPNSDMIASGIVPLLLFLLGTLLALARWRLQTARLVLVWSGGVVVFLLFFSVMQQWHPFAYRYFVLVSPWVAITGAWGIEQLGRRFRPVVWTLVMLATVDVAWWITTRADQSGWKTVAQPNHVPGYYLSNLWREWSQQLDHTGEPFRLVLPARQPIDAFYRQWPPREVIFKPDPGDSVTTAEDFVRGETGWVIVPAFRFLGHEGNVAGSTVLIESDEGSYSLAAYRPLQAGEKPQALIYRLRSTPTKTSITYDVLVRTVPDQLIRVTLANPANSAYEYIWRTSLAEGKGVIAAAGTLSMEPPLPSDGVGKVTVVFNPIDGREVQPKFPTVRVFAIDPNEK